MADLQQMTQALGGMDPFDGPIPGESLTSNPDTPMPYEKPAEYTSAEKAVEFIFNQLIDENNLDPILDLMRQDLPVENIAQVIIFEGFRQGKWNPDLMLILIEPVIYVLLALAEYAGIDAVLYPEEDMDEDDDENYEGELNEAMSFGEAVQQGPVESETIAGNVIQGVERPSAISESLMQRIQNIESEVE